MFSMKNFLTITTLVGPIFHLVSALLAQAPVFQEPPSITVFIARSSNSLPACPSPAVEEPKQATSFIIGFFFSHASIWQRDAFFYRKLYRMWDRDSTENIVRETFVSSVSAE
jgi:hypothetical protein